MNATSSSSARAGLATAILVTVASLVGFVLTEAAYRLHLYRTEPYHFTGSRYLWYFQNSPYRYSEEFGYEYVPGHYGGGAVFEGMVTECFETLEDWAINARGNSGRIRGSYDEAELKILVFGDSVTQRPRQDANGEFLNWPNFLQDRLERELGVSVHVVNFARDGYGVLQMLDLAVARVREWQPDLAIIAFISDDLTRARSWRTTVVRDGRQRVLVSSVPDPDPDWDVATDAYLVQPGATPEWCRRAMEAKTRGDPIVRELEEAFLTGQRRSTLLVDPWSLRQSLVYDRIRHGDPYFSTYASARPSQLPRHELRDFSADERTVANLRSLETSGVPILLVHVASITELETGVPFSSGGRERERRIALVESLARLARLPVYATLDYSAPIADVAALAHRYPQDKHPSLRGHEFIADSVARIVLEARMP